MNHETTHVAHAGIATVICSGMKAVMEQWLHTYIAFSECLKTIELNMLQIVVQNQSLIDKLLGHKLVL